MAPQEPAERQIICGFCGRSKEQAPKLVAGPYAYICADCVAMCNEILAEEEGAASGTRAGE